SGNDARFDPCRTDEGPVEAAEIAETRALAVGRDLQVIAAHRGITELQLVPRSGPDGERLVARARRMRGEIGAFDAAHRDGRKRRGTVRECPGFSATPCHLFLPPSCPKPSPCFSRSTIRRVIGRQDAIIEAHMVDDTTKWPLAAPAAG